MTSTLTDLGVVVGLALVFLGLSWSYIRSINIDRPLTPIQRKMLLYSFLFVLGMGCVMLLAAHLHWRKQLLFPLIGIWGALLAAIAWWQYKYRSEESASQDMVGTESVGTRLKASLPIIGLLVALIGGAIEWERILEGNGRWWVGLLWIAAGGVAIASARRNRKATVIVAVRGVIALLAIGALVQQRYPVLIAAAVAGLALFLIEKLWPNDREVPFQSHG
jgi:hypothetical protein